ncbi:ribonuclease R [Pseudoalteromonas sp. MEBiC 03607]|nr:ribonuclease R [Pseudoalteromonas sp. MEBiC 03607]TGV21373.1 ribonuclease R [Pseudoalteromonas sp. MEBiC 03607]
MLNPTINVSATHHYENPIPAREYIISLLANVKKHLDREQIAQALNLKKVTEKEALRRRLRAMERDGQLLFKATSGYQVIDQSNLVTGTISIHADGFGFVKYNSDEKDLFLPKNQLKHVFDGDTVKVLPSPASLKRSSHKLINVVTRNTTHVAGILKKSGNKIILLADNAKICHPLSVDRSRLAGAKIGQYVNCEILHYPNRRQLALVGVTEVLGEPNSSGLETKLALLRHGACHTWSADVVAQAASLGQQVSEDDKKERIDYRHLPFMTIDGEDAKDFDDAVYCERTQLGDWRLLVAIADVSHYVKPDDILDVEAQTRATSIYCPGLVVPMLPESLSNGLCSLNPNQDRLVLVCDMTINSKGKMTQAVFTEGVIHSHARLTYEQANRVITGRESQIKNAKNIIPHIKNLHSLYNLLNKVRKSRDAIEFETIERKLNLNKKGKIESITAIDRNDAHRMIEEFMLSANVATANFLEKHKVNSLFRVHAGPQSKKLSSLKSLLSEKGLMLGGDDNPTTKDYNALLSQIEHRSDGDVIRLLLLRSQSQAEYSVENKGHFGLAYDAYAHFTSPIRRYPDLITHRAIRAKIQSKENSTLNRILGFLSLEKFKPTPIDKQVYPYSFSELEQLSLHCSLQSRQADEISREVEASLKCQYMKKYIGQTFEASVSGVASFGVFVELKDSGVEGMISSETLGEFEFDADRQLLASKNTKFTLGKKIRVVLEKINTKDRKMSFTLAQY